MHRCRAKKDFTLILGRGIVAIVFGVFVLTIAAYGLFFAYDILTVRGAGTARLQFLFFAGCVFVVVAFALLLISQMNVFAADAFFYVMAVLSLASFAFMVKALFFSLPRGTYSFAEQGRPVYQHGMYAFCRHPGVFWYCLGFLFLALAFRSAPVTLSCLLLCAGNVAYMVFQDAWSFPRTFCDYRNYQRNVPFFFPTRQSIRSAISSPSVKGGRA